MCSVSVPLVISQPQVNNQDVSFQLQAAVKNIATNAVFYFVIPLDAVVMLVNSSIDVGAFAAEWKTLDESHDVSKLVKGK